MQTRFWARTGLREGGGATVALLCSFFERLPTVVPGFRLPPIQTCSLQSWRDVSHSGSACSFRSRTRNLLGRREAMRPSQEAEYFIEMASDLVVGAGVARRPRKNRHCQNVCRL